MKAEIIAIGTELVSGQSLDTNSQWLSRALGALGIPVHFHTSIGDDMAENLHAFQIAIDRADLIITSGGLGPTQDDLTREVLAEVAGVKLVEDAGSLLAIETLFAGRNRTMTERNRVQALMPEGAEPLANPIGTAPGIGMKVGRSLVACLPGVPKEMKRMFDDQVVPLLKRSGLATRIIVHRKINLFGKGESDVEAEALDLTARGRIPEVGITASEATISFRIAAEADTEAEALALIQPTADLIHDRFADLIVGEGVEDVADALYRELARTGFTIATDESCTAGWLAYSMNAVPGMIGHYHGGTVGPAPVSEKVAADRAIRARHRAGTDFRPGDRRRGRAGLLFGRAPRRRRLPGSGDGRWGRDEEARTRAGAASRGHSTSSREDGDELGPASTQTGLRPNTLA